MDDFRSELEEAAHAFEEAGDDTALATVWTALAEIEWMPCRYDRSTSAARRAIDHARRSGDERVLMRAVAISIIAHWDGTATPEEGIRALDDLNEEISRSRRLESLALVARAFYRGMQGDLAEARRLIGLADEIVEALGVRLWLASSREVLGDLELNAGDATAAARDSRERYRILDELADEARKSTAAAELALALCALERFDEAEVYAETALRIAAEDDLASQTDGRSARALVLAARGEFDEAERLAREAVELYADAEAPNYHGDAWMYLANVLRTGGKLEEAAQAAREALALYERKGNRPACASTRVFIEDYSRSE